MWFGTSVGGMTFAILSRLTHAATLAVRALSALLSCRPLGFDDMLIFCVGVLSAFQACQRIREIQCSWLFVDETPCGGAAARFHGGLGRTSDAQPRRACTCRAARCTGVSSLKNLFSTDFCAHFCRRRACSCAGWL